MTLRPGGARLAVISSAVQSADPSLEPGFAAALEGHRRELQVHCYRMLGSFEESEDLVQETFLRAWRKRASFPTAAHFGPGSTGSQPTRASTCFAEDQAGSRRRRWQRRATRASRRRLRSICRGCSRTPTGCSSRSPPRRRSRVRSSSRGRRSSLRSSPRSSTCHLEAGGADPPRRAGMVGKGHGFAAGREPRLRDQRVAAGARDPQGPPARAADGVGASDRADGGGARAPATLRGRPRARRCRGAGRAAA